MRSKLVIFGISLSMLVVPIFADADDAYQEGYFKHSIGIGSYALTITNDHPYYEDDNLSGFAFFGELLSRVVYGKIRRRSVFLQLH